MKPSPNDVLLDVGGDPSFWTSASDRQCVLQIDTLNVYEIRWNRNAFPNHNIRTLVGDGCALNMADNSYDIVFSNSVIEHVGSWERQQRFAAEIRRVAKGLWVQTPAYECPIEPHYLAPFIHYLPKQIQRKILRWLTPRGWFGRPSQEEVDFEVNNNRLLKKREFQQLFPDCKIMTERLLFVIPKSYIAFRPKS
jgi:hypothetical protein